MTKNIEKSNELKNIVKNEAPTLLINIKNSLQSEIGLPSINIEDLDFKQYFVSDSYMNTYNGISFLSLSDFILDQDATQLDIYNLLSSAPLINGISFNGDDLMSVFNLFEVKVFDEFQNIDIPKYDISEFDFSSIIAPLSLMHTFNDLKFSLIRQIIIYIIELDWLKESISIIQNGDILDIIDLIIKWGPFWDGLVEVMINFLSTSDLKFASRLTTGIYMDLALISLMLELGVSYYDALKSMGKGKFDDILKIIFGLMAAIFAKLASKNTTSLQSKLIAEYYYSTSIGKIVPTIYEMIIEVVSEKLGDFVKNAIKIYSLVTTIPKTWEHFKLLGYYYQVVYSALNIGYKFPKAAMAFPKNHPKAQTIMAGVATASLYQFWNYNKDPSQNII